MAMWAKDGVPEQAKDAICYFSAQAMRCLGVPKVEAFHRMGIRLDTDKNEIHFERPVRYGQRQGAVSYANYLHM